MHVIPVLDLKGGWVVHGVAGLRSEYRPIRSRLTESAAPLEVARAFREHLGLTRLYVADLDAIVDGRPHQNACRALRDDGFELLLDSGARRITDAVGSLGNGAARVVIGLETWSDPESLIAVVAGLGRSRIVFSLDLHGGVPLAGPDWDARGPLQIVETVFAAGVRTMIVLDVATVGTGRGVPTVELCRSIRDRWPQMAVIAGGGVRNVADLNVLAEAGVSGALVATALHSGEIGREACLGR